MIKKYYLKRNYIENIFLAFTKSIALTLLLILISLLISSCNYESIEEKKEMQSDMTDFLQEKYDKEFVVDRPEGSSSTLSSLVTYTATAYPKDNPEVVFKLVTDFPEAKVYHDNYLKKLWSYQGETDVSSYLENMYGEKLPLLLSVSGTDEIPNNIDYHEVLEKHGDKLKFTIIYCVIVDENFNKEVEVKKAFDVFKNYIIKNKIENYLFSVEYIKEEYKNDFFELYNSDAGTSNISFGPDGFKNDDKILNTICFSQIDYKPKEITNPDFIKSLFKY